jgi:REP element-mobilizing transposase RayT
MVLAYHVIITAYGFWLPNDPRGSWSDFVRSWELFRFGPATKTSTRRSVARSPHDHAIRHAAKAALKFHPVTFTGQQCLAIAHGFKDAIRRSNFIIHACAILPTHTHLVIARHRYHIEQVRDQLKGQATKALRNENLHPFAHIPLSRNRLHTPWADDGWDVYLNTPADILRAIQYVNKNPTKERLPPQTWSFITPYPRHHRPATQRVV